MLKSASARRGLRYVVPWLGFGLTIALLILWLEKYRNPRDGFEIFAIAFFSLSPAACSALLLNLFLQRQEAGVLLLNVGRLRQTRHFIWIGFMWAAVASLNTWMFFEQAMTGSSSSGAGAQASMVIAFWSFAIGYMGLGLSKLQLREKGVWFAFAFITWQRIRSYHWAQAKPNTLIIRFTPQYLKLADCMNLIIPAPHHDAVTRLLDERLPGKHL